MAGGPGNQGMAGRQAVARGVLASPDAQDPKPGSPETLPAGMAEGCASL